MIQLVEKPVPWPNGARAAVAITFDIDIDSILHLAHPEKAHRMIATQSLLRYERIAVKRIVDVFSEFGIQQTFFFPAWCMEQYPDLVDYILEGGHEIGHHGYIHESPNQLSPDEELYWLQKGIDIIKRMTGKQPRGWRAPLYHMSESSTDFLIDEGFLYDASLMGDDVPYILRSKKGDIIEIPSHWALDDWGHYAYVEELDYRSSMKSPDEAMNVFMSEFEAAWKHRTTWVSVWHPMVSGRLARCDRIVKMIEQMLDKGQVWFATMEQIAAHVQACIDNGTYDPSVEPMPTYAKPIPASTFNVAKG
jgi:peptidoglycan/xylan/chitin deacetylase (PgdA/CDA1 family)